MSSCRATNAKAMAARGEHFRKAPDGWKSKDLMGLPWRVALALHDRGWFLRADIIWHKPSPVPESVRDRPTKAHEYVFLLTRRARYFYDAEAISERVENPRLSVVLGREATSSDARNPATSRDGDDCRDDWTEARIVLVQRLLEAAKRAARREDTGAFWRLVRAAEDAAPGEVDEATKAREARRA